MKLRDIGIIFLVAALIAGIVGAYRFFSVKSSKNLFNEGLRSYSAGNYAEAVKLFKKLKKDKSKLGRESLIYYARCLKNVNSPDCERAWLSVTKLSDMEDRKPEVFFNLGVLAYEKEDIDKAKEYFNKVSRNYPGEIFAGNSYYYLGLVNLKEGDLVSSRENFLKVIQNYSNSDFAADAQDKYGDASIAVLFSKEITPLSERYIVQKGDTLSGISKKYNTTVELLREMNKISDGLIRIGDRLKVPLMKFSISIDKSQNKLMLLSDGKMFKIYTVGTGRENSTPTGKFTIISKLVNPPWRGIPPEDPRNILGTRWMGFNEPYKDYGIHGTTAPETIGTQSSAGCVRMYNMEVEELYKIIPYGAEITIVD